LAGQPKVLIENPAPKLGEDDVLSDVLRTVRLSGSLQFCFMPTGAWQTDDKPALGKLAGPSTVIPFHIVVEGGCWLKLPMDNRGHEVVLAAGDVVAFPFGTGHQLGAGAGGRTIVPTSDLPPTPWREIPVLHYGTGPKKVRLLCGYLHCDAVSFRPLREALPALLHVRTRESKWLSAAVAQIVLEVDAPRAGGISVLERLTEILFIELLRHQVMASAAGATGWLAALADPALARCLGRIHDRPAADWSLQSLARESGLSRTTLTERFEAVLKTSPMRYVRDWRLCLASIALGATAKSIAAIADEAGYGTEAAFTRAFTRTYGLPPATWRQTRRKAAR
jgi:AraC-like DNA-binding protein